MKSDESIFEIWPRFIATGERLGSYQPTLQNGCSQECRYAMEHAVQTLIAGRNLINWVSRARVPMPRSTEAYLARCAELKERLAVC